LESHLQKFDDDALKQQLADCLTEEKECDGKS